MASRRSRSSRRSSRRSLSSRFFGNAARSRGPNRRDLADAAKWEAGGRKKFVAWVERKLLPLFEEALVASDSLAGELFGEAVFDKLLRLVRDSPEMQNRAKFFGYPGAAAKDSALMGMWGQTVANLRYRHPDMRGRLKTSTDVYARDYATMRGIVETLKTLS